MKDSTGKEIKVGDWVRAIIISDPEIGRVINSSRTCVQIQFASGEAYWYYSPHSKYITILEEPMRNVVIEIPIKELGEKVLKELFALGFEWVAGGQEFRVPVGKDTYYLGLCGDDWRKNKCIHFKYAQQPLGGALILSYSDFMEEAKKMAPDAPVFDIDGRQIKIDDEIVYTYEHQKGLYRGKVRSLTAAVVTCGTNIIFAVPNARNENILVL